jgi:hypothetical protein
LSEVQRLMGHRTPTATRHYARERRIILDAKLEYADSQVLDTLGDPAQLPLLIAARLHREAEKYLEIARDQHDLRS